MRDHFIWKEIKKIESNCTESNSMQAIFSEKQLGSSETSLELITSQNSLKEQPSEKTIEDIERTI